MDKDVIALGLDNGSGTVVASARRHGICYEANFPTVYNTGDKLIDIKGRDIKGFKIDPDLNGNCNDFSFPIKGGQRYHIGQSAYTVDGDPVKSILDGRYKNSFFMKIMIYGAIYGLVQGGMTYDKDADNIIKLYVGLPPEDFYKNKEKRRQFINAYNAIVKEPFQFLNAKFVVDPEFGFMAEGLGAYYEYIFDDGHNDRNEDYSSGNVLVVDAGAGTLDTAIIENGTMRKRYIQTSKVLGVNRMYSYIIDDLRTNYEIRNVKPTDVEQMIYTKTTGVTGLADVFDSSFENCLNKYIIDVVSNIGGNYSGTNNFNLGILTGGLSNLCENCNTDIKDSIESELGGVPFEVLSSKANARGYRKATEASLIENLVIEKTWE